jgi:hypothetical protein
LRQAVTLPEVSTKGTQRLLRNFHNQDRLAGAVMRLCLTSAVAFAFTALGTFSNTADAQSELGWRPYLDERTGTRVDFPSALFPVAGGATERGIGRVFESKDGRAKFSAYTLENDERDTPGSYLQKFLKVDPSTIDYRRVTNRFFAVSGIHDGKVYYSRCNFQGAMHCIYISYPERELRAWDGIVTRISLTLRGPRNAGARR